MTKILNSKLWSYVGRFSLIHVISYSVIALAFLVFQEALPASDRTALDFFQPYNKPGVLVILKQAFRGGIFALILYPFYSIIVGSNRGWLILTGVLWGLALLGSVEPVPGSIEGLIYTTTTLAEHFIVLVAWLIQVFLFSWLFLFWERWYGEKICYSNKGCKK